MTNSRYGFGDPYVDVDEWREVPRRHRYVHGGFEGSATRFSCYFPPPELYRGRLLQFLEGGVGGHENVLAAGGIGGVGAVTFDQAFDEFGAYLVESNQGHGHNEGGGPITAVHQYGASAESARHSKVLAEEMYGTAPHHGYVFGASGGGYRSIACIENEPDLYDGACPTIGTTLGVAQQWSAVGYWWLHARHALEDIVDAMLPGGNGDPFATLTHNQREALAAVYRHGYPRGSEAFLWFSPTWAWAFMPPSPYYDAFWNERGYLGHDNPESIASVLVDQHEKVGTVFRLSELAEHNVMAALMLANGAPDQPAGMSLDRDLDDNTRLLGACVTFTSGKAKGRRVYINGLDGRIMAGAGDATPELFEDVEAGDDVHIDNRRFVAWCHLHRYQVAPEALVEDPSGARRLGAESRGLTAWTVDGMAISPRPPQPPRDSVVAPTGQFRGKMIYVYGAHDSLMWPVGAGIYDRLVHDHLGDRVDDSYRLWWVEHLAHGPAELVGPMLTAQKDPGRWHSAFVGYDGINAQAMRDLVRWVEDGVAPPSSTAYRFTDDSGLVLAATAVERGGIQPLVAASVNGGAAVDAKVGESVHFRGTADQPPGTGSIVWASWDFEGDGNVSFEHDIDGHAARVDLDAHHAYQQPGTYFASLRVGAHRDGSGGSGAAAENLALVRVRVHE